MGLPATVAERWPFQDGRRHAIGHTRMATESAVTTEHSSLYARRRYVPGPQMARSPTTTTPAPLAPEARPGVRHRQRHRSSCPLLRPAIVGGATPAGGDGGGLADLDGFYTFTMGTKDGFAVVRDAFACKPAVLAETDDWVAMASNSAASPISPYREGKDLGSWPRRPFTPWSLH